MKRFLSLAGACLLLAGALVVQVGPASAQDKFPSKTVEMIVPWGPGSGADILGRLVSKWLESELKVPVPGQVNTYVAYDTTSGAVARVTLK